MAELDVPAALENISGKAFTSDPDLDLDAMIFCKAEPIRVCYKCEKCFDSFASENNLEIHLRKCEKSEEERKEYFRGGYF